MTQAYHAPTIEAAAAICRRIWEESELVADGFEAAVQHRGILAGAQVCEATIRALPVSPDPTTPAARWRENGEPDPHGDSYDCERAKLCGGHLSDDEVAYETAMLMRHDLNHEAVLTTAKDRIRWLSRSLEATLASRHEIVEVLEALERANEAVCAGRSQWAYDQMILDGQDDDLLALDKARSAARDLLSKLKEQV